MNKVHVNASRSYDIFVGEGLLDNAGRYIAAAIKPRRVCVVTDDNVDALYSERLLKSLEENGFSAAKYVFPHGEASKCHKTLLSLYDFLAENSFTRSDALIALGGGVTGDLTGFAAASYMRGIGFVQIPTTVLAQTDSSVGGKTAVDIAGGKNLVGAFYQPQLVLCDTETLSTLTPEFFADGMAEVVKYGMIRSRELFDLLTDKDVKDNLEDIITRCVSIKAQVVENDERDTGERMILNFGHTLGHAIEKYYNYCGISHGYAVAIGMSTFTHIAEKKGMCASGTSEKLDNLLKKFGLPLTSEAPLNKLFEYSLGDKKRNSSGINIVLCPEIGKSGGYPMTIDEYREFLGAGYPGSVDLWK